MLEIITYFWKGGRAEYKAEHVNTLARMVARHYKNPHRFSCVTNYPDGISPWIRVIPDTEDFIGHHPNIGYYNERPRQSCFRRLRHWRSNAKKIFGKRIVSIDLDTVIVDDLSPLFDRTEDVILLEGTAEAGSHYNGTVQILNAGARPQVWEKFDPQNSPDIARARGFGGTDQAWLSYVLGPNECTIGKADGVFKFSKYCKQPDYELPEGARLVHFAGRHKPWDLRNEVRWIKDLYQ